MLVGPLRTTLGTKEGVGIGSLIAWEFVSYIAVFWHIPGHIILLQAMKALGIMLFLCKNTK